jgi:hypothetical protein
LEDSCCFTSKHIRILQQSNQGGTDIKTKTIDQREEYITHE